MKLIGAEAFVETLKREGVDTIFGFPGGAVLPIYDILYKTPEIRHILTRHEQGAAHAADGYARVTGKPGVCIATSGPGATNLVTGLATASMDSIPVVAFTGQVPTSLIGNDAFQEADIFGITSPITKHNYLVKDAKELPHVLREAFHIAKTGRPGPVLVDLPRDVQLTEIDYEYPKEINLRSYKPTYKGHMRQIKLAAKAIAEARRPVIIAGGGIIISGASEELFKLAELTQIPVTTTLMGLGVFPETHPLSLGMPGMHGTWYANYAITESDLIIAIGMRFDDRVTGKVSEFAPHAKVIHIDIDPSEIGKNIPVDIPIVGDAKLILKDMLKYCKSGNRTEWHDMMDEWKREHPLRYKQGSSPKPQYIVEQIYEATNGEAIITTEVGQNQMWAAQFFTYTKPRTFISSGGLGTMGYGFPASIGAKIGRPDKHVFCIAGDGSFQMNTQELATAVANQVGVKVAILNNKFLGMVRQWQQLFYDRRYSATCLEDAPDFVKLAEAYGAKGIRIKEAEEVRPAIEEAIETDGPVIMDFLIPREENVFPMVPAGAAIKDMIEG